MDNILISIKNIIGDFMDDNNLFTTSLDIAQEMIECGGEIHRAEEAVIRTNRSNKNIKVFALPTMIIAQDDDNAQIRRIYTRDENLSKLTELNAKARRLCGDISIEHSAEKEYSPMLKIISIFFATASFCIFFGGGIIDAFFSGFIGIIITYAGYKHINFPIFSSNLIDAFIAGTLALIPRYIGINTNYNMVIIGTIMLLVPGLTVVNAIGDMMNDDLTAGLIELVNAVMSALSIAFGIGGALILFNKI